MSNTRDNYVNKCLEYTLTQAPRLQVLWNACQTAIGYGLTGSFVECGVYKGGSSMLMAYCLGHNNKDYPLVLFDTFKGMTRPTERDVKVQKGDTYFKKWEDCQKDGYTDWCYGSIEEVKDNLSSTGYENISYIKGDIVKTNMDLIKDLSIMKSISILRVDTDFYESTKFIMNNLFPLVCDGGFVIFDDYYCWKGAKDAVDEYFEENGLPSKDIVEVDHSCAIYQVGGQR